VTVHHVADGDGPPLILSSSLGTTHRMWDANVPALASRYRLVRYDHPGHGESPPGPRTIEGMGRAVLELADALELERFAFCGISLGGFVGIWLGANTPERLDRLFLCCTAPRLPPPEQWLDRAANVRAHGVGFIADSVVARWFTPRFDDAERYRDMLASTPAEGYARCCEAIAPMDLRDDLSRIKVPTTVIFGRHDPVTGEEPRRLLGEVGDVVELDGAHLASVEAAGAFDEVLLA
jgi:3-oxoadipate enol-lactonase